MVGGPRAFWTTLKFGHPRTHVSGGPRRRDQRRGRAPSKPGPHMNRTRDSEVRRGTGPIRRGCGVPQRSSNYCWNPGTRQLRGNHPCVWIVVGNSWHQGFSREASAPRTSSRPHRRTDGRYLRVPDAETTHLFGTLRHWNVVCMRYTSSLLAQAQGMVCGLYLLCKSTQQMPKLGRL